MKDITAVFFSLEKYPLFGREIGGNSVAHWLAAVIVFFALYYLSRLICGAFTSILKRTAQRSENEFDNLFIPVLESVNRFILIIIAFCLSLHYLDLPAQFLSVTRAILAAAVLIQAGFSASAFFDQILTRWIGSSEDPDKSSAFGLLAFLGRVLLWAIVLIAFLDNLGVDITALVAGLGVGGIAVALAVQNILGDLLASLSIILDKPFRVGDFLVVGDTMGTVERIGIKTTRLKSISGEQYVLANSDLLSSRIRNFKRMYERRIAFTVGVTYQTAPEQLKKIPPMVKEFVDTLEDVRFDRAHFKGFGDSALLFEIVYFVLSPEYGVYMDKQQDINFKILEFFTEEGIEFAYPTQTLFLEKGDNWEPVAVKEANS